MRTTITRAPSVLYKTAYGRPLTMRAPSKSSSRTRHMNALVFRVLMTLIILSVIRRADSSESARMRYSEILTKSPKAADDNLMELLLVVGMSFFRFLYDGLDRR